MAGRTMHRTQRAPGHHGGHHDGGRRQMRRVGGGGHGIGVYAGDALVTGAVTGMGLAGSKGSEGRPGGLFSKLMNRVLNRANKIEAYSTARTSQGPREGCGVWHVLAVLFTSCIYATHKARYRCPDAANLHTSHLHKRLRLCGIVEASQTKPRPRHGKGKRVPIRCSPPVAAHNFAAKTRVPK